MHINLQLTDDTELRAHGYLAGGSLFAEVQWDLPFPNTTGAGVLWGSPDAMRRLAAFATQAARQAEEEAAWQAHTATMAAAEADRVA